MSCEHIQYVKREAHALTPDDPSIQVRTCKDCGHVWMRCEGELRFAPGRVSAVAAGLLMSREARAASGFPLRIDLQ